VCESENKGRRRDKGVLEGAVSNKIVCDDRVILCYLVPSDE
jgi:hypothetical protein